MNWLKRWIVVCTLLLGLVAVGTVVAQEADQLELRLSRDFGAGFGTSIQGRFSFRVDGPDNLETVSFYIDDQLVGEDSEAPFRLQFETDNYPLGTHTLYAIGRTTDGKELQSNQLSRNFISSSSSNRTVLLIVVPILVISLGGGLLVTWIANRGRKGSSSDRANVHGPFGGTICPKCNKPFARHIWGLNLGLSKFDRCPHCGKWSLVRALPADELDTAVQAMEAEAKQNQPKPPADDEDNWHKRLDDSKFDS
ncbi:Ig-like domain-containing protein [Candidatus Leptofilum sp.]|uniref:Ig-like domain-containing protein n=1 Tax=Candidatus Leptofilum sp. TaxID=3241576 RepID=UPI003B58C941